MVLEDPFVWTARRNLLNQSDKNTRRYLPLGPIGMA
jgi:hypothetical protein